MNRHKNEHTSVQQSFVFHEAAVALTCCLLRSQKLCCMLDGLLLGERERCSRAGSREARVGVHRLIGRALLVGVLRQESNGRISWSRLRLREIFHVVDALVVHIFSWVQLFWKPPRVLWGEDKRRRKIMIVAGHKEGNRTWGTIVTPVHCCT